MLRPFFLGRARGFSLVEVVVAVGIFAIAVIACVGLLGPINTSVSGIKENDDAARVVGVIQEALQRQGLTQVNSWLTSGSSTIYASRTADKIGTDVTTAPWNVDVPDLDGSGGIPTVNASLNEINAQKFFEIRLSRNAVSGPLAPTDGFLALNLEIRWPGYSANGLQLIAGTPAADQQSVLVVPVAITR